jgi:hypothetical protein
MNFPFLFSNVVFDLRIFSLFISVGLTDLAKYAFYKILFYPFLLQIQEITFKILVREMSGYQGRNKYQNIEQYYRKVT